MSRRFWLQMIRHEWRTLVRRNLAGLIAGLLPVLIAPFFGMMAVSLVRSFDELGQYGPVPSEGDVILVGLAVLCVFPIMYAVFLTSDVVVLECELGTMELIFSAPVRELDLLIGKILVPFLFNVTVGAINLVLFSGSYVLWGSRYVTSPWSITGLVFLLLLLILCLAVSTGVWVSSLSVSTKAAATISLTTGSLLALAVIGLGVLLRLNDRAPLSIATTIAALSLILNVGAVAAVVARFGDRERYFLNVRKEHRDDTR